MKNFDKSFQKEYIKQKREREKKRKLFEKRIKIDEKPLIKDLSRVGIQVRSVWDLVNTKEPYPEALDILLDHLTKDYHPKTLAGIAGALGVPEAIPNNKIWDTVVNLYIKTKPDEVVELPEMRGFKEGLAVAISIQCTLERLDFVIDLIKKEELGESRIHLVYGLRKFRKDQRVREFVESICNDSILGKEASKLLNLYKKKS